VADTSWIGRSFEGRYRIEAQLGNGGVGRVYRARHLRLDRPVALKVLHKQHNERWVSRQRFEREARALGQLSHPHIVAVTDFGIEGDVPFLVMELLSGQDLTALLRGGALAPALACRYTLQLLDGLGFVHGQGLVHRDIKPGNVYLERAEGSAERVKLLDFGLARLVVPSGDASVSRHGEVLGTPAYMAPERIGSPESVDPRADVYGAGALVYFLATGRPPFDGKTEADILRDVLSAEAPRLRDVLPQVPPALDELVARCLAKDADLRPRGIDEIIAVLSSLDVEGWTREDARAWWQSRR
jgi:eukaryotic-like serine/threonine-protein kinase